MKKLFLFSVLIFTTTAAWAYIPPYWMIMSRTADNHGKGPYRVDQDVVFNHGDEPLIVNEKWILQGENSLRLEVTGRRQLRDRIRLTYVYQNGRRYFVDENGVKRVSRISDDFFEPFFHFRYSKNIKSHMVAQNIAPAVSLRSEPHKYSQKKPLPESEPYVRLSRVGGVVTYGIGTPTPVSGNDAYPGVWIEQDQFLIRKIRLPSQLEVSADQYKNFSKGLWLPRERMISWPGQSAKIVLNGAVSLPLTAKIKESLESNSLNFGKDPNLSRVLPDDAVIKDFYSRLR